MKHFEWGARGPVGPQLMDGEIVIQSQLGVAIYDGDAQTDWQSGKLSLTSCRLVYESEDQQQSPTQSSGSSSTSPSAMGEVVFLHLKHIASTSKAMGFGSWSHPKITVKTHDASYCKFSFRSGGADRFHAGLVDMLARKLWVGIDAAAKAKLDAAARPPPSAALVSPSSPPAQSPVGGGSDSGAVDFRPDAAGIAGVIRRKEEAGRSKQQELDEAMKDITSVMTNVGAIVAAINRLKSSAPPQDDALIISIEASLGLGATVTADKLGTGASLHLEIARELNAWLSHRSNPLSRHIVVPLVELFSLYNRARGEELLSPDDVLRGCECMASLPDPAFQLRRYRWGVAVLQRTGSSLTPVLERLLGPRPASLDEVVPATLRSVTEAALAADLAVSNAVATDVLLDLEDEEVLCRAESAYGVVRFYWNIFALA